MFPSAEGREPNPGSRELCHQESVILRQISEKVFFDTAFLTRKVHFTDNL